MKKTLITGSNGLLGQKLVKLLLDEGVDIVATSRGDNRIDYLATPFEYCELDITDAAQVEEVMHKYRPDVVIHTAAMTNVDQCEHEQEACHELNVAAVGYLVKACEAHQAFLIHLSTDFIFDGEAGPYKEDDEANPISYYGESKREAEQLVQAAQCDWAILRTVLVYGITPGMSRSNIILWVKENLEKGKPLNIVDDQWRTPTLAEDLAMGCYLVAKQKATGIFNISGEEMLTPYDMAMKTADYFQLDASVITKVDASTFSQPAKRPPKTGFVLDKAKKTLGYQPHSFEEGIRILDEQVKTVG
ncbi:dTDP-4-dehydrorhamnose reductase [Reichenbachiella carrageenanivorans]|uniref:dTDP-4-dehydrorhamnose reductase n=1 Tax=Reichenbachiella carrageenanivorans TaxID=2979869 RepID=A0ABY6D240_9BACT|nr:dTDP-4-dehydrorhamnose reductase [Reichenbachiella carrageenanivorans]UXX80232.1 dTDP-4-dehydrorhamnose reductase [Reichenbachiella carrageenanivorans]